MKKQMKAMVLAGILATGFSLEAAGWGGFKFGGFTPETGVKSYMSMIVAIFATTIVQKNATWVQENSSRSVNYITSLFTPSIISTLPYLTRPELSTLAKKSPLNPEIQEEVDKAISRHKVIALYGPAGTGKTTLAQIIAAQLDVDGFISISKDQLNQIQRQYRYSDLSETDIMKIIIEEASKITPTGGKFIVNFEEWGDGTNEKDHETLKYIEACKAITGAKMGDGGKPAFCPNVEIITTSNATSFDQALARRMHPIKIDYPTKTERIDFYAKSQMSIDYNSTKNAQDKLIDMPKTQQTLWGYVRSLCGFKPSDAEIRENQNNINQYFKDNYLVTDAMIAKAQEERNDELLKPLQTNINELKTSRTLTNSIIPEQRNDRKTKNHIAANLENRHFAYREQGCVPALVTTKGLDHLEQHPQFLKYLESKTNTITAPNENGKTEERTPSKAELSENYLKEAERLELASITTIKDNLPANNSIHITAESNQELFTELNNHRKYKAGWTPDLARNAKNSEISHYTLDKENRTYTAFYKQPEAVSTSSSVGTGAGAGTGSGISKASSSSSSSGGAEAAADTGSDISKASISSSSSSPEAVSTSSGGAGEGAGIVFPRAPHSAPVTFGDIGKRNLGIAACKGDMKQYKKDEIINAATVIQRFVKNKSNTNTTPSTSSGLSKAKQPLKYARSDDARIKYESNHREKRDALLAKKVVVE